MRYAIIENGTVVNVVVAEPDFAEEQGWTPVAGSVATGWAFNGDVFEEPAPKLPPVPESVTPMRAKLALLQYGLLDAAEATIAQANPAIRIMWSNALEFRRDDPAVNAVGAALKLTSSQMDDLFRAAASAQAV